jgi:hypothetical protein
VVKKNKEIKNKGITPVNQERERESKQKKAMLKSASTPHGVDVYLHFVLQSRILALVICCPSKHKSVLIFLGRSVVISIHDFCSK